MIKSMVPGKNRGGLISPANLQVDLRKLISQNKQETIRKKMKQSKTMSSLTIASNLTTPPRMPSVALQKIHEIVNLATITKAQKDQITSYHNSLKNKTIQSVFNSKQLSLKTEQEPIKSPTDKYSLINEKRKQLILQKIHHQKTIFDKPKLDKQVVN
eukprot:TRINITY_DN9763_c0_g2_i1.p2 TRINITY_DN9763_c0_g2~~TRINITY_DN9763_c0_g2_i1.p2  ORF type:complete len:157 (+),score=26.78 TRINITY_DN9763_c0_g2_i1:220-690(+)